MNSVSATTDGYQAIEYTDLERCVNTARAYLANAMDFLNEAGVQEHGEPGDSPAITEQKVVDQLTQARHAAESALVVVRRQIQEYRDRKTHAELMGLVQDFLTEQPAGSIVTAVELKMRIAQFLDSIISDEIEGAERAAGWDSRP